MATGTRARGRMLPARPAAILPLLLLFSIPLGEASGQAPESHATGSDAEPSTPPVRAEMRLSEGGRIDLSIFVADEVPLPSALRDRIDRGEGSRFPRTGEAELAWTSVSEKQALEVLREARQADDGFSLRILMAPGVAFDDIWELQAALSQAGIRRVQFVTGER